jgi:hypothetical protein
MPKITKKCEQCGEEFEKRKNTEHPCRFNLRRFCDRKCSGSYRTLTQNLEKTCQFCNKKYKINKCNEESKYCSKKCFDNIRRKNIKNNWVRKSKEIYGYNCQKCSSYLGRIDCHHIDGNDKNNPSDGSNWIRLCRKCHHWVHKMARTITRYPTRQEILGIIPIGQRLIKKKEDPKQLRLF